jgi:hypothetical protein
MNHAMKTISILSIICCILFTFVFEGYSAHESTVAKNKKETTNKLNLTKSDQKIILDGEEFTKEYVVSAPTGDKLVEFVRENEDFEGKWTKLVGVRLQNLPGLKDNPLAVAKATEHIVKMANPDAKTQIMVNKTANEAVIHFMTWDSEDDFMEFNVFRYVKNKTGKGILSLQFAHRFTVAQYKNNPNKLRKLKESWINQIVNFDMNFVNYIIDTKK